MKISLNPRKYEQRAYGMISLGSIMFFMRERYRLVSVYWKILDFKMFPSIAVLENSWPRAKYPIYRLRQKKAEPNDPAFMRGDLSLISSS